MRRKICQTWSLSSHATKEGLQLIFQACYLSFLTVRGKFSGLYALRISSLLHPGLKVGLHLAISVNSRGSGVGKRTLP